MRLIVLQTSLGACADIVDLLRANGGEGVSTLTALTLAVVWQI